MDIRNWSLNEILQLPDHCFGPRWWVGDFMASATGAIEYKLGGEVLPHRFAVWGVLVSARSPACLEALRLSIRLAGSAASSIATAVQQHRLLDGITHHTHLYELTPNPNGMTWIGCSRQIVEPSGGRLSLIANGDQVIAYEMTVGVLISAVPTEIPDWLIKA